MMSKFFTSKKIYDNVTLISCGTVQGFLVEGTERALLIDTLCGVGSLKGFVRELTDLPVTVVITHGHVDHAPGALEFGSCFIHPDDIALMYSDRCFSKERRLNFVNMAYGKSETFPSQAVMSDVIDVQAIRTYPVYEGDVFDLGGGVKIEVIEVPGHTYGTIVLLDEKNNCVYSGDACNVNTLINLPGSTTIEEYKESLLHFKTYQDRFDVMWGGHGPASVPKTTIDDGIALCDKILAGEDDAIETVTTSGAPGYLALERGDSFLPKAGGTCNIVYSKDMLRRRPHPEIKGEPNLIR